MNTATQKEPLCNHCVNKNSCPMAKVDETMKAIYEIYQDCDFTPVPGTKVDANLFKKTHFFLN